MAEPVFSYSTQVVLDHPAIEVRLSTPYTPADAAVCAATPAASTAQRRRDGTAPCSTPPAPTPQEIRPTW